MFFRSTLVAFLLISAACGPHYVCPEGSSQEQGRHVLEAYAKQRSGLTSIVGEARIDSRGNAGRVRGTVMFIATRDGKLRFDVLTQFGPVATLTSDGKEVRHNDLHAGRFIKSGVCAEALEQLFGVPLTAQELAAALLGLAPSGAATPNAGVCGGDGLAVTREVKEGVKETLVFRVPEEDKNKSLETSRLELASAQLAVQASSRRVAVAYDDYTLAQNFRIPKRVSIKDNARGIDILVRIKEVSVNEKHDASSFTQPFPEGGQVEVLMCEGDDELGG